MWSAFAAVLRLRRSIYNSRDRDRSDCSMKWPPINEEIQKKSNEKQFLSDADIDLQIELSTGISPWASLAYAKTNDVRDRATSILWVSQLRPAGSCGIP